MQALTLERRDGVGVLRLDVPGEAVNKITAAVREELGHRLDELSVDDTIRAVVLASAKRDAFIAGADINEFVALRSREEAHRLVRAGQGLINRLARLGKPVVAAVHGACVGGGLEAALACTYRIATDDPKTRLGLPEIQIGILPALGGCQRLPRLIGVRAALELILTGRPVPAHRALRLGIVDEVVHPAVLENVAVDAARRLAGGWRPKHRRVGVGKLVLDHNGLGRRLMFTRARQQTLKRTGGHYPAPLAALQAVQHGLRHGMEAGLDMEAAFFSELAVGEVSRSLVRIFFATTALKKDQGVEGGVPPARPVERLAIVGAGFMGASIGAVAVLQAGVDVRLRDVDLKAVGHGVATARAVLRERMAHGRITRMQHRRLECMISGGANWDGFGRADLVLEAVFEDLELKREVVRDVEHQVREDCVIATNTSTIPIGRIASALGRPERLLGMHFFSPVEKMPLLEVIATAETAPWVVVSAMALGRRMGKTVIVVRDRPGFWVNRILAPYLNEAGRLLEDGVDVAQIDGAMTDFGFPVGPVTLVDEIGWDVAEKASRVLHEAFGEHLRPMAGIARMTDEGRLGRKTGRGFYRYDHGKKREVDQSAYEVIGASTDPRVPHDDLVARLVYVMLNEAVRAVDEGVVRTPRDGDIGAVFGIGFPPFRGGPLRYIDTLGAARVVATLERLAECYGARFQPAPALRDLAARGGRYYPND